MMNFAELSCTEYNFMSMLSNYSPSLHYVKSLPSVAINDAYLWAEYVRNSRHKFHMNFLFSPLLIMGAWQSYCKFRFPPEILDLLTIAEGHIKLSQAHDLISLI